MGKWVHRLSNKDMDNLTADCIKCGPVKVRRNGNALICPGSQKDYDKGKRKNIINPYFGITYGEIESLKQGGSCFICGTTEELRLDHDHSTGKVRGVLCNLHNLGLGKFRDNIEHLERAVIYLKQQVEIK